MDLSARFILSEKFYSLGSGFVLIEMYLTGKEEGGDESVHIHVPVLTSIFNKIPVIGLLYHQYGDEKASFMS